MKKKGSNPYSEVLRSLGLSPDEWLVEIDIGKPLGYNPTNFRSYVGVTLTNLATGSVFRSEKRGKYTKRQARKECIVMLTKEVQKMRAR